MTLSGAVSDRAGVCTHLLQTASAALPEESGAQIVLARSQLRSGLEALLLVGRCALVDRAARRVGSDHLAVGVERLVLRHVRAKDAGEGTDLAVLDERGSVVGLHRSRGKKMSLSPLSTLCLSPQSCIHTTGITHWRDAFGGCICLGSDLTWSVSKANERRPPEGERRPGRAGTKPTQFNLEALSLVGRCALVDRAARRVGSDHLAVGVERLVLRHVRAKDAGEGTDLAVLDERGSVVGLHNEGGISEGVRHSRLTSPSAVRWNESV